MGAAAFIRMKVGGFTEFPKVRKANSVSVLRCKQARIVGAREERGIPVLTLPRQPNWHNRKLGSLSFVILRFSVYKIALQFLPGECLM